MYLRVAICWLSLASAGICDCHEVQALQPVQSSPKVTVTVVYNGKPVPGSKVTLEGQGLTAGPVLTLTNRHGEAEFSKLAEGNYSVEASWRGGMAYQSLTVREGQHLGPTRLKMPIIHSPDKSALLAAQDKPAQWELRTFSGLVKDLSGAPIPLASIQIYKKGQMDEWSGTVLQTDQNGHAIASLADGEYVAFIQSSGFQPQTIAFAISSKADQDLKAVILYVGSC